MNSSGQTLSEAKNAEPGRSSENLALLYQGLLTIIVRLQAGREQIPDPHSFRAKAKKLLLEAECEAKRVGYEADDIKDASLAIIAFLDSVVLHTSEVARVEWVRQTLAQDLLEMPNAGEIFFVKLDELRSRRNSPDGADVLEVYALCLLLGFEGRYSERERGELNTIKDKTRRRVDEIRGKADLLSPAGALPDTPTHALPLVSAVVVNPIRRYAAIALGAAAVAVLCFIFLKLDLVWEAQRVSAKLL